MKFKTIAVSLIGFVAILTAQQSDAQIFIPEEENNIPNTGEIIYKAESLDYKLHLGIYKYSWSANDSSYKINTSLKAEGFASLLVDYSLREEISGIVKNDVINWKEYVIFQEFAANPAKNSSERAFLKENGKVQLKNEEKPPKHQPYDIPSVILRLMNEIPVEGKSLPMSILYINDMFPVNISLTKIESVIVPAGKFECWLWEAKVDNKELKIWFNLENRLPIQIVFTNSKGLKFLLSAKTFY